MREPAGKFWFELLAEIGTHVQITYAGTSAEPLQHSATGEISVEGLNVYRDGTERLESIQHDEGSDLVSFFDDGFGILNERTAEDYVRDRNEQGLFVDGVEQPLGRNGDAIVGLHHVDASAVARWACQKYMTEGKFMSVYTTLLRLPEKSKQEATTAWQVVTF